jgi:hypothetical protein
MSKAVRQCILFFFAAAVGTVPAWPQQSTPVGPAPIPPQIVASKKVFISNLGTDGGPGALFVKVKQPITQPYNLFYAAMKTWGRYELVAGPGDADLVFELHFTGCFELTIVDAKTHFTLWPVSECVEPAIRGNTWLKNVDQALGNLMDDIRGLVGQPPAPSPAGNQ